MDLDTRERAHLSGWTSHLMRALGIRGHHYSTAQQIPFAFIYLPLTAWLLLTAPVSVPVLGWCGVLLVVLVSVAGMSYGGVSVSTQTWVARAAPARRDAVSALWVSVFNASIAVGALTGGQVYDSVGPDLLFWTAGGVAAVASVLAISGRAAVARASAAG